MTKTTRPMEIGGDTSACVERESVTLVKLLNQAFLVRQDTEILLRALGGEIVKDETEKGDTRWENIPLAGRAALMQEAIAEVLHTTRANLGILRAAVGTLEVALFGVKPDRNA